MKTLQKLFLLSVLGLGVYVHETFADANVDQEMHKIVEKSLMQPLNMQTLPKILANIKTEISALIKDKPEYKNLFSALKNLNTASLMAVYTQIHTVLQHTPPSTQALIKGKLKAYGFNC